MIEKLQELLTKAYAPYSKVKVSAIVVTKDNHAFSGVNIENASYGGTICAERVAITKAVSEGYKTFKEIHILSNLEHKVMPCFLCRQTFIEFFDDDTRIYVYDLKGNCEIYKLKEICPFPFDSEDLK